jgi:putative endonuclease
MFHVYVIASEGFAERYYIGFSTQIEQRLAEHNGGKNPSTSKYRPWRLAAVISFPEKAQALRFERYLKGGSGRILKGAFTLSFQTLPRRLDSGRLRRVPSVTSMEGAAPSAPRNRRSGSLHWLPQNPAHRPERMR